MMIDRHQVVAVRCPIRDAGLDLERNAQRRDARCVHEVNVHVLADILLLVNL